MRLSALAILVASFSISTLLGAREPPLRLERLTAEDGLPQVHITGVIQDGQGFLWIGSTTGLYRYDGVRFVLYRPTGAPGSLPHSHIRALCESRREVLWVGTYGGGLVRFEPVGETFVRPRFDGSEIEDEQINVILEGRDAALWIGTQAGLLRLDTDAATLTRYLDGPCDRRITALYESPTGTLWLGTERGLARFDQASERFDCWRHAAGDPGSLRDDRVRALLPASGGHLRIGTFGGGLGLFDPGRGRWVADERVSKPIERVTALLEEADGVLWIGTYGAGLLRFDPSSGRLDSLRHDPVDSSSLSDDRVEALAKDRGGILWISTRAGLNKLNPLAQAFRHVGTDPFGRAGLAGPQVRAVHEDRSGHLWIGTTKGLDRLDRDTGRFTAYRHDAGDPSSLGDPHVSAILEDGEGVLWVGTPFAGVSRLDREKRRFRHYRHDPADSTSLSHDDVTFIAEDRSGRLWIGTWGGGLNRFERAGESFVRYRHDASAPGSLADDHLLAFHEGPTGRLWIGTFDKGVAELDPSTGDFRSFRLAAFGPTADRIAAIHQDPSGVLWLGTWGGLIRCDLAEDARPGAVRLRAFTRRDGLPSDSVLGILPDERGRLWISTAQGLARFDPGDGSWRRFDTHDGLRSHEFNLHSAFRGRAGELFFGTNRGLTYFDPAEVGINPHIPPLVLTSLRISGRPPELEAPLSRLEALELDYRNTAVTLEFAALDYAAPSKNRYAYHLEGAGPAWVELGTRNEIVWPHLEPGSYLLRVRGSNNHGVWNEDGLSIRLEVRPPWWSTWWWRLSVAALVVASVSIGFRRRMRLAERRHQALRTEIEHRRRAERERERLITELEARNAELERFTYTVSHDLKSPLFTIQGFLGLLRRDVDEGDLARFDRDLQRISEAAGSMGHLLDELLELSRIGRVIHPAETVDLGELAREAGELTAGSLAERGVELRIAAGLPTVTGDRVRLSEVFVNLIENSVKFLGDQASPKIEVGVRNQDGDEVVYVRDNGVGIDPRYHDKIFGLFERLDVGVEGTGIGLALVQRIVQVHGGRIWVESEGEGAGSTFCFTLASTRSGRDAGRGASAGSDTQPG